MLYLALVSSELKYAAVAWNFVTVTDSNKLERIQKISRPSAAVGFYKVWNIITVIYWKNYFF
jgi:hypothetical protein